MKNVLSTVKRRIQRATLTRDQRRHSLVGPPKLWKMKRDFQIRFLKNAGLESSHYLMDIGCGTLRGGIPLIDYLEPGHYCGVESREEVLDEGRRELEESGLAWKDPTLIASEDITLASVEREFDFIWAYSVLIHMSNEILLDTLGFVSAHLLDEGVFYANVNIGERREGNWQGFPIVWKELGFYEEACSQSNLVLSDLGTVRNLGHVTKIDSHDEQRMLEVRKR